MTVPGTVPVLRLDWLVTGGHSGHSAEGGLGLLDTAGRVALSSCPGRPHHRIHLPADLRELGRQGVGSVLSLVAPREMALYGVEGLAEGLQRCGIRHFSYPVEDLRAPPDVEATRALCQMLLRLLGEGERLLVHCIGGWGRSGTIAAALLTHEGYSAETAISLVRQARHPFCVQTAEQEDFVRRYAAEGAGWERRYHVVPRAELERRLLGEAGERALLAEDGAAPGALPMAQVPAALEEARRRHGDEELLLLSGEVRRGAARDVVTAATAVTTIIDRAHAPSPQGLRPVPLGEVAPRSLLS